MPEILVAGVGNVLRGDDGFGVRVAQALASDQRLPGGVRVIEIGIGGMSLVQDLLDPCDALILFDAVDRGDPPGRVLVMEPEFPDLSSLSPSERRDVFCDVHYATPSRALMLAAEMDRLPSVVRIVGCQVARTDRFEIGLDPRVEAAIPQAIEVTLRLVRAIREPCGAAPT